MATVRLPFDLLSPNPESGEARRHEVVGGGDSSSHLSAKTLPSAMLSRAAASRKLPRLSLAPPPPCGPYTADVAPKKDQATEEERTSLRLRSRPSTARRTWEYCDVDATCAFGPTEARTGCSDGGRERDLARRWRRRSANAAIALQPV